MVILVNWNLVIHFNTLNYLDISYKLICGACVFLTLLKVQNVTDFRMKIIFPGRVSRTERSGRYGSIIDRDDRDERESRSRRRDSDYKRSSDDRRGDRYDDYRDYDSPEVSDQWLHNPQKHPESYSNRNSSQAARPSGPFP